MKGGFLKVLLKFKNKRSVWFPNWEVHQNQTGEVGAQVSLTHTHTNIIHPKKAPQNLYLAILCDLFGMVKRHK